MDWSVKLLLVCESSLPLFIFPYFFVEALDPFTYSISRPAFWWFYPLILFTMSGWPSCFLPTGNSDDRFCQIPVFFIACFGERRGFLIGGRTSIRLHNFFFSLRDVSSYWWVRRRSLNHRGGVGVAKWQHSVSVHSSFIPQPDCFSEEKLPVFGCPQGHCVRKAEQEGLQDGDPSPRMTFSKVSLHLMDSDIYGGFQSVRAWWGFVHVECWAPFTWP